MKLIFLKQLYISINIFWKKGKSPKLKHNWCQFDRSRHQKLRACAICDDMSIDLWAKILIVTTGFTQRIGKHRLSMGHLISSRYIQKIVNGHKIQNICRHASTNPWGKQKAVHRTVTAGERWVQEERLEVLLFNYFSGREVCGSLDL